MYTGRAKSFELSGETFNLSRPSYSQMAECAELVEDGKILEPLLEAVDNKDKFEAVLKTADHEDVGRLFDAFCEHAGVNDFLVSTLQRINARNEIILAAMTPEQQIEATTNTSSGLSQPTG